MVGGTPIIVAAASYAVFEWVGAVHYLLAGAMAPYKRFDLAMQAFRGLGRPLVVAGGGQDEARLHALAFLPDQAYDRARHRRHGGALSSLATCDGNLQRHAAPG